MFCQEGSICSSNRTYHFIKQILIIYIYSSNTYICTNFPGASIFSLNSNRYKFSRASFFSSNRYSFSRKPNLVLEHKLFSRRPMPRTDRYFSRKIRYFFNRSLCWFRAENQIGCLIPEKKEKSRSILTRERKVLILKAVKLKESIA